MKQIDFPAYDFNGKHEQLCFQKHLEDKEITVISVPRIQKLTLKRANRLYNWLGRAIEEAERLEPHNFKEGDRVRVRQVIRNVTDSGCVIVEDKYIYGHVEEYSKDPTIAKMGPDKEWDDRRVEVIFDTKEPLTCPICLHSCGHRRGFRVDPKRLELVTGDMAEECKDSK